MTLPEALNIIDQALATVQGNRASIKALEEAFAVVKTALGKEQDAKDTV